MADLPENNITQLLKATREGHAGASDQLFEMVYAELRRIAKQCRFVGLPGATMQATVLANEAYLELSRRFDNAAGNNSIDQDTFYRSVALAMRTILRDYWRRKTAEKRGGDNQPVALIGDVADDSQNTFDSVDFLALDEALTRLESFNGRWFAVVAHRYLAGRNIEETARMLDISVTTVKSDWQLARAWLRREMLGGQNA